MSELDAASLLTQARRGEPRATEQLLTLVYDRLRATAGQYLGGSNPNHTLQPTALVHEAYLKLIGNAEKEWESRAHFLAVAATAMRHLLQDHAKAKRSTKRGGEHRRTPLTLLETPSSSETESVDLLALDDALQKLANVDPQGARVIELRFFGGLSNEEITEVLDTSLSTVERTWRRSRAWMRAELDADAR